MLEIKVERVKRGLRQSDVAKMVNISQQKLSCYERGIKKPSAEDMSKLDTLFSLGNGGNL